jgi:hypothetical protein
VHWQVWGALSEEGVHHQGMGAPIGQATHYWQRWGHWSRREALAEEHWQEDLDTIVWVCYLAVDSSCDMLLLMTIMIAEKP